MFDIDLALRALLSLAFVLFLTPAVRGFGLSPRVAGRLRRAGFFVYAAAVLIAMAATALWFWRR